MGIGESIDPEKQALELHKKYKGKLKVVPKFALERSLLPYIYTPHVANVCKKIQNQPELWKDVCLSSRLIAIFSNGTRTLGLGNIGPYACYPVMESKAFLVKALGGIDAIPLVVEARDKEVLKSILRWIRPSFGCINLEDIEKDVVIPLYDELKEEMCIFHDDRHGTGIVTLSAVINTFQILNLGKEAKIVVVGAGTAGLGIVELLHAYGVREITVIDSEGQITEERKLSGYKQRLLSLIRPRGKSIEDAFENAEILIAASKPGSVKKEWIRKMRGKKALFLLANPQPEIPYEQAVQLAPIVGTGRSDYPNQVNNILALPGIMKAAVEKEKKKLTLADMIKAAEAIASSVIPRKEQLLPDVLDKSIPEKIKEAL